MIDVALTVMALVAGGLSLELYAAGAAQTGHEDGEGRKRADDRPSEHPA